MTILGWLEKTKTFGTVDNERIAALSIAHRSVFSFYA
jgi:hypothetical protein